MRFHWNPRLGEKWTTTNRTGSLEFDRSHSGACTCLPYPWPFRPSRPYNRICGAPLPGKRCQPVTQHHRRDAIENHVTHGSLLVTTPERCNGLSTRSDSSPRGQVPPKEGPIPLSGRPRAEARHPTTNTHLICLIQPLYTYVRSLHRRLRARLIFTTSYTSEPGAVRLQRESASTPCGRRDVREGTMP